jgi:CRP/FNR family transcriptional regulator, nitrogen oxide reductase regulator
MVDTDHLSPLSLLAQAPLFAGQDTAVLQHALPLAQRRTYERGTFIFHEGDPATLFYILETGRVRLTQLTPDGQQIIIRYLGPGEGMGIIVVLSDTVYPVTAEIVADTQLLCWYQDDIKQLMLQYPTLALSGLKLVAQRFVALQAQFRELATERVEQRVARTLLRLVRQAGRRTDEGVLIDMPLSRQDLAEMTGTTLYTVSRILSKWEQAGLIQTSRERVVICQSHEIVVIAEDLPRQKE